MKCFVYNVFIIITCLCIPFYCTAQNATTAPSKHPAPVNLIKPGQKLTHTTFRQVNNTWGYQIAIDNRPYIRQTTIPGQMGELGFTHQSQAEKAAQLVKKKMLANQSPGLTPQEIQQIITTTSK